MKASAMVAALLVIVVGSLIVGGLLFFISKENIQSRMLNDSNKALYIAEAGLEDVLGAIAYDMKNNNDFLDLVENETLFENTYEIDAWKEFGEGTYRVELEQDPWDEFLWRLISTGRYGLGERAEYEDTMVGKRRISQYFKIATPMNTALFVGGNPGSTSGSLAGNGQIRGTVYVMGEEVFIDTNENNIFDSGIDYGGGPPLGSGDTAVDARGNFYIGNNYEISGGNSGIPSEFYFRVPSIIIEGLETLGAWLKVKHGQVEINSNSAQVGKPEETEDVKEYMDGVIVPDGIGGTHPNNVYTNVLYDDTKDRDMFPETLRLPSLYDTYTDPDTGITYNYDPAVDISGRLQYYRDNGLRVYIGGNDGDPDTDDIIDTSITPDSTFDFVDGDNSFSLDGSGNMQVEGIVFITLAPGVDNVVFERATGSRDTINYMGNGVIVTPNDNIEFNVNLYTSDPTTGDPIPYPEPNAVGFMTPENIDFSTNNTEIMAFFYAGGTITTENNIQIAGSLMAQEVTIDLNSSIFQVNGSPPEEMIIGMPVVIWVYNWFEERFDTGEDEE